MPKSGGQKFISTVQNDTHIDMIAKIISQINRNNRLAIYMTDVPRPLSLPCPLTLPSLIVTSGGEIYSTLSYRTKLAKLASKSSSKQLQTNFQDLCLERVVTVPVSYRSRRMSVKHISPGECQIRSRSSVLGEEYLVLYDAFYSRQNRLICL
jgi:hypothetical protein